MDQINTSRTILLKNEVNTRRSQRVVARIRVQVHKQAEGNNVPTENSYTLVVNAHGALILLANKVEPNDPLIVKNVQSGAEQRSRVVRVSEYEGSQYEVSIEFTEPAPRFWNIEFPPSDWKVAAPPDL